MMKKWLSVFTIVILVMSLVLAGCGTAKDNGNQGANENPQGEQQGNNKDIKIGMVTDVGGVNDNSFNQSAWEGLQKLAQDTGVHVEYLQSTGDSEYIPNLNQFVKNGFDLTWGIGFLMADHVAEVASQNPDAKLGIIDGVVEADNVASVLFAEQEGSFLVGVVAGLMTKTNKIGFVGGMEIPVIKRFEAGFKAGVKAANPNAQVQINYTGAFDKPDLGKAAAASLYDWGADIVFHAAGATGDGVFNEAKTRKNSGKQVWVIGVDKDQSITFGHDVTLTSMMKRVDHAVYLISKDLIDGKFEPGVKVLGLKEDAVGLPEDNPNIPKEVLDKVEEFKQKIINGEIQVPQE